MSKSPEKPWRAGLRRIFEIPGRGWQALVEWLIAGRVRWRNWRLRRTQLDYVLIPLSGSFPERSDPPRGFLERRLPLPQPAFSLQRYNGLIQRLIDADNLRGVVFNLQGVTAGLAGLQSLRQGLVRLRESGKTVVVYTHTLGNGHYYLASAADRIIVPPVADWEVFGLYSETVFLRDALAFLGIEIDNIQISPYKSAANSLSEREMTQEQKEQLDWLLDDRFDQLTADLAAGRGQTQEEIKSWIDRAPLTAEEALAAGLVDDVAYEDELEKRLAPAGSDAAGSAGPAGRVDLLPLAKAARRLRSVYRRRVRGKKIAVVSLEGLIVRGSSQQPPVDLPIPLIGGKLAGDQTISRMLRQVETDDSCAALVFHVDSRGGDALASDVIGREIARLARKIPIVVYMGDVAASGGYYVSAMAREIVSQPGTITGSIGVVIARPNTDRFYEKLQINRVGLQRGAQADLLTDRGPLSPERRQILEKVIQEKYRLFKQVVAGGRSLDYDSLDPVCEGRVWTGRQALSHRLVDRHGGIREALWRARELAGLPMGDEFAVRVENIHPEKGGWLLPRPFPDPASLGLIPAVLERLPLLTGPLFLLPFFERWPFDRPL